MARFDTREITEYRLRCEATWPDDGTGCAGTANKYCCTGNSESEAIELAQQDGWLKIQGLWACPAHVRGRENAEAAKDQPQKGSNPMTTKHTDGAVKAAKKIMLWRPDIAAIIDQETGLPEITAERDRLREAVEVAQETIDRVFTIMDNKGKWSDAEIWLNNLAETNQAALAKKSESEGSDDNNKTPP